MAQGPGHQSQLTTADDALRRRINELITACGEKEATRLLETPRHTLARVMAGFSVRHATLACLRMQLDKHAPIETTNAAKEIENAPA